MEEIRNLFNEMCKDIKKLYEEIRLTNESGTEGRSQEVTDDKEVMDDFYNKSGNYGVGVEDVGEQDQSKAQEKTFGHGYKYGLEIKNDQIKGQNICFLVDEKLNIDMEQDELGDKNLEVFEKGLMDEGVKAHVLNDDYIKISTNKKWKRCELKHWICLILKRKESKGRRLIEYLEKGEEEEKKESENKKAV